MSGPSQIVSRVGSGVEDFRQKNHGQKQGPFDPVMVMNFEDQTPCWGIFTSGFTVHTTAVRLPPRPSTSGNWPGRRVIAVFNNNTSGTLYVGPSGVTTANGYPVPTGTEKAFGIAGNLDLWGVGAASGIDCRTMEIA